MENRFKAGGTFPGRNNQCVRYAVGEWHTTRKRSGDGSEADSRTAPFPGGFRRIRYEITACPSSLTSPVRCGCRITLPRQQAKPKAILPKEQHNEIHREKGLNTFLISTVRVGKDFVDRRCDVRTFIGEILSSKLFFSKLNMRTETGGRE